MPHYKDTLDTIKAKASEAIEENDAAITRLDEDDESNTVSGGFGSPTL